MAADIRVPGDEHREEIARCLSRSLNFPLERALARAPRLPIEDFRCAFEEGRVVATAAEHHFVQWFLGRPVQMSGIWAVSTLPEHRAGSGSQPRHSNVKSRALVSRSTSRPGSGIHSRMSSSSDTVPW